MKVVYDFGTMILDHETPEEIAERRMTAEQSLDAIYHAIPEWVHRAYPNMSLAEKVAKGFAYCQKEIAENCLRDSAERKKSNEFLLYLMDTHKLSLINEYWNFLRSKDIKNGVDKAIIPDKLAP